MQLLHLVGHFYKICIMMQGSMNVKFTSSWFFLKQISMFVKKKKVITTSKMVLDQTHSNTKQDVCYLTPSDGEEMKLLKYLM